MRPSPLADAGKVELPTIPEGCVHNAHMFYLKCKNLEERTAFIRHLKANDILAVFHYILLHSAPAGEKFGRFDGEDVYTTAESERLVRLPMYYGLTDADREKVIAKVLSSMHSKRLPGWRRRPARRLRRWYFCWCTNGPSTKCRSRRFSCPPALGATRSFTASS